MLHGLFLRQIDEEAEKGRWLWLRSMGIKRESESLIMAAQEQAIRTNVIKAKIDNTQEESKCRMCGRVDETVNHVLSESSKMVQTRSAERGESQGKCPGDQGPGRGTSHECRPRHANGGPGPRKMPEGITTRRKT